jgi:hypothetical protein
MSDAFGTVRVHREMVRGVAAEAGVDGEEDAGDEETDADAFVAAEATEVTTRLRVEVVDTA